MNRPGHSFPDFLRGARVLDLSYSIADDLPPWPGDGKSFEARTDGEIESDGYFARSVWMREHYGTHLDAPAHFIARGRTVEAIPAERLFGAAVVVDVQREAATDADYELAASRIAAWEKEHGRIPRGGIVLLRTGWASRWPDAARYCNQDAAGTMHFPGFGRESVQILIERGVSGIGCDTMSVDPGCSQEFPVHRLALGAGLYQLENVADLSALPEAGAFLVVAPIKLQGGSGGPCRVFAILP
jgi:kynurenine formamidase